MKKIFFLSTHILLLLLIASCQLQRAGKPEPSGRSVRVIRHSDLPIKFTAKTRDRETHRFLVLLNRYRQKKGLSPLIIDKKLRQAAQWMSKDMAVHDYLSHYDSKGRDPFKRLADFGYNYNTDKAENVAAGQQSAAEVLQSWQSSRTHNRNMLDPHFTVIGIGFFYGKKSKYGWYWATSFGGRKSK
ncbi:MAG: CAP domain-containing protein [Desulfobacteraceae bacterium]|jgi:uncharacterized protein YkwD